MASAAKSPRNGGTPAIPPTATEPKAGRRLPVESAFNRVEDAKHRLPRLFGPRELVVLGLGVIIGSGIFSLSGRQAAGVAGPAVILSFVIAAVVCLLAALCYAELSSTIPVSGSAYTFTYVAFGEIWAWLVGLALMLELVTAAAIVARVWSSYFVATLSGFDLQLPETFVKYSQADGSVNLVAPALLLMMTFLIVTGTKLSARVLTVVVIAKVGVIALVVAIGAAHVKAENYTPFIPDAQPTKADSSTVLGWLMGFNTDAFGIMGIFTAASDRVRVHRLRPDRDRGRGRPYAAQDRPAGHVARGRRGHRAVHRDGGRTRRHAAVLRARRCGAGVGGDGSDWGELGRGRSQPRCAAGADDGDPGGPHRAEPGPVQHGPRRSAAEGARPGQPRVLLASPRRGGRWAGGGRADLVPEGARLRGTASARCVVRVRVLRDRRTDPAPDAAESRARVPGAAGPIDSDPLAGGDRVAHAQPQDRHLGAVPRVDGGRAGLLRPVRPLAQPAGERDQWDFDDTDPGIGGLRAVGSDGRVPAGGPPAPLERPRGRHMRR